MSKTKLVFDSWLWREAGGDQPDGNAQFWRPATILRTRVDADGTALADVRFHHDGRVSCGHIYSAMRETAA